MSAEPSFRQIILAAGRGHIQYRINAVPGGQYRLGYRVTPHFAVTQVAGQWWPTHLPSGRCLGGLSWKTKAEATRMLQQLETVADWSRVRKGTKALAQKVRAVTGGQPMRRIG